MFSVSYLRGKRVTTLSNKRETGAQFTTHGTLRRGTAKSGLAALLCPTVTNEATVSHKLFSSETQTRFKILFDFFFLKTSTGEYGSHFLSVTLFLSWILYQIQAGINKDIASLHQHEKICAQPVKAAYRCNLILMNPTIKQNNHKFCSYYCISAWIELDVCQSNALVWLRKSGSGSEWLILCPVCSDTIRVPSSRLLNLKQSAESNCNRLCY